MDDGNEGRTGGEGGAEIRAHVIFSGIVQGVFFRAHTRRQAQHLNLVGWVRNLPDGTVEAWIEGERPTVERLLEWCRHEMPLAQVDRLEVDWGSYTGEFGSFEILR